MTSTGKSYLTIKNNYKVDFTKNDTFKKLIGFESKIVSETTKSDNMCSLLSTQKIYIYCDIIQGSNFNGKGSKILYSFGNSFKYGSVISLNIHPRQEKLLNKKCFNSITFNFKDENNKPINFQGESVAINIEIKSA